MRIHESRLLFGTAEHLHFSRCSPLKTLSAERDGDDGVLARFSILDISR